MPTTTEAPVKRKIHIGAFYWLKLGDTETSDTIIKVLEYYPDDSPCGGTVWGKALNITSGRLFRCSRENKITVSQLGKKLNYIQIKGTKVYIHRQLSKFFFVPFESRKLAYPDETG